jgi:hypothetical protein
LRQYNLLVRDLLTAVEQVRAMPELPPRVRMVIDANRRPLDEHERRYNAPSAPGEVSVLFDDSAPPARAMVLALRGGGLTVVSDMHCYYDAVHFVLLHSTAHEGWREGIKLRARGTIVGWWLDHPSRPRGGAARAARTTTSRRTCAAASSWRAARSAPACSRPATRRSAAAVRRWLLGLAAARRVALSR